MRVNGRFRFEYAFPGGEFFKSGKKKLLIQKYADTCGPDLKSFRETSKLLRYSENLKILKNFQRHFWLMAVFFSVS